MNAGVPCGPAHGGLAVAPGGSRTGASVSVESGVSSAAGVDRAAREPPSVGDRGRSTPPRAGSVGPPPTYRTLPVPPGWGVGVGTSGAGVGIRVGSGVGSGVGEGR